MSVHIKDIIGPGWKEKAEMLHFCLKNHNKIQKGGNLQFLKKLKGIADKAKTKFGKFLKGETKFKPSDLAKLGSNVAEVTSVILGAIPETKAAAPVISALGKVASKGSDMLKQKGLGYKKGKGLRPAGRMRRKGGAGLKPAGMRGGAVKVGSYRQVYNGSAMKTSGGLKKEDLMMNKRGKIVSKRKHEAGLKRFKENKLKPRSREEMAKLRMMRAKK